MELYEMLVPGTLKGGWSRCTKPVSLNAYLLKFNPIPLDREYTQFALFLESALPKEAETMKVELHLAHGRIVNTELIHSRSFEFDPIQLRDALRFQEVQFRIMLDRPDFLENYVALGWEDVNSGNSSTSYLLLPVQPCDGNKEFRISWKIIKDILSSPIFSHSSQELPAEADNDRVLEMRDSLRLANGWVPMETIQNSLVLNTRDKKFYCIVDILHQTNSNSKHNVTLEYKEKPLLKAKQLARLRNLLHNRSQVNAPSQIDQGDGIQEHFVNLPPELCCVKLIGFSSHLASAISLLPSMMHRLENFLVAIELKDLLSASFPEGSHITASKVLEAITTERCNEGFSLERLEVLGDAFLKYSVSLHIFMVNDKLGEGQLTQKRSDVIKNSYLYERGKGNGIQAYIRDEYFDPKKYFALGRPCKEICTPDKFNMIHYFDGDNTKPKSDGVSVRCTKWHHWMHTKTIADVVEALIGAYLVESGFKAALSFIKWIGIEIDFDPSLIEEACIQSSKSSPLMNSKISEFEGSIGHSFTHKGLLLEAFTHPSYNEHNGGCYQRLEFLGDAFLDYMVTSYLYSVYPHMNPGHLTDMRSMTVNNEYFACVAVRHRLYLYLIQKSESLSSAVTKYVDFINTFANKDSYEELEPKCPKVLGDLVESFAGALLIDTGFHLEYVWNLMLKILEPIVTPETFCLQPVRELTEICQCHDLTVKYCEEKNGNEFLVEAKVSGKNVFVVGIGERPNKKVAKKFAAQYAISKLKSCGIVHPNKILETFIKKCHKKDAVLIGNDKTEKPALEIMITEKHQALNSKPSEASFSHAPDMMKIYSKDPDEVNLNSVPSPQNTLTEHETHRPLFDTMLENNTLPTVQNEETKQNTLLDSTAQGITVEDRHSNRCQNYELASASSEYQSASASHSTENSQFSGCAISRLYEFCQKQRWESPTWVCCKEEGLPHHRSFTYMVVLRLPEDVSVECLGESMGSKKLARESAARGALRWLNSVGFIKILDGAKI